MDVVMPQLGETVKEGTVTAWRKKKGEHVEMGETLFEVTTDKVDTEVPSPASGVVASILVPEGKTVAVGVRLAVIQEPGRSVIEEPGRVDADATPAPSPPLAAAASAVEQPGEARLSPVVRKLIAEHGLDPARIRGTGSGGRITRDDVLEHVRRNQGGDERVPLGRIRQRTAEQMSLSWRTIPHVLQAVEVDFDAVDAVRGAHRDAWKAKHGFALSYLPFIAHSVCRAIAEFPRVNASLDGDALVLHRRIHLGIAVDLGDEGLIVPVVKDAAKKPLAALARALHSLAEKARAHRLAPDDVTEATYTLSNSGAFGTLLTAPIIDPPQVAILSTDAVTQKPVVRGEKIVIRPVGVLAQSFDHRAFDGAYSARFLRRVKELLETSDWAEIFSADGGGD